MLKHSDSKGANAPNLSHFLVIYFLFLTNVQPTALEKKQEKKTTDLLARTFINTQPTSEEYYIRNITVLYQVNMTGCCTIGTVWSV